MTIIIAPNGNIVGSTFEEPQTYAASARDRGWKVRVVGDRVYLRPGVKLAAHIREAEQAVGR